MTEQTELPFPREEYALRLDNVRHRMEGARIEVPLTTVHENGRGGWGRPFAFLE